MKIVNKEALKYQDADQNFLREIKILSELNHDNIIKMHEYFVDSDHFYIILDLIEGVDLYKYFIKTGTILENDAKIIMKQILSTLNYLHTKGIIHRDVKPENILIEKRNDNIKVKLIDFGSGCYFQKKRKLTQIVGSSYYVAPEVINKNYTYKCDLWSCGVILYFILTGVVPFEGSSDEAIMRSIKRGVFSLDLKQFSKYDINVKSLIKKLLTYSQDIRVSAEDAMKDNWLR